MEQILLTKKELAKALNISVSKIDYDIKLGLPFVKMGKSIRFQIEEVKKYYGIK
jgi:excisionase family DNA binding protein